jgi:hypothetical protein
MLGGLAFDDDRFNAGPVQQLAQQQAGGPGPDDGNLGSHMDVAR